MKEITFYEVTANSDTTEGRGHTIYTGICFDHENDALAFAQSDHYKPYAVMGVVNKEYSKFNVKKQTKIVYECFNEYDSETQRKIDLKQSALDKLTEEEKEILGLIKIRSI